MDNIFSPAPLGSENNELVNDVKKLLAEDLSDATIEAWFGDMRIIDILPDSLTIFIPQPYKRTIVEQRYTDVVEEKLEKLFSHHLNLVVLTEGEETAYIENREGISFPLRDSGENLEFTFDRFVVGASNRFAHAAAMAVAEKPASAYNPLFIYGESGLGKTHLLCAIGNVIRRTHAGARIHYVKGDDFTNELILAIRNKSTAEFREKYRQSDLLLLDDIQFIAGKESTMEEFFHTFNVLYESKKQIVLTADRPPKDMYTLEDRLRTRFEWGLIADIQPPDYETRVAIVKNKAELLGLELPDSICQYIASSVTANVRQLEGTVKKILAKKTLMGADVTFETVNEAIKDMVRDYPEMKLTPSRIIDEVSKYYNIQPDVILSTSRRKDSVLPRQIAMYILRETTGMSLPEIGKEFGRDHTTVMHSINKVETMIKKDEETRNMLRDMMSNISQS